MTQSAYHAIGSREHASETGRNFHERGLSALRLGHLEEAQRLLDEAVRLKGEANDQLLSNSYLAQAGLAVLKGNQPLAIQWLLAISNLDDVPSNARLRAMMQLLTLTDRGVQRLERIEISAECVVRLGNPDDVPFWAAPRLRILVAAGPERCVRVAARAAVPARARAA